MMNYETAQKENIGASRKLTGFMFLENCPARNSSGGALNQMDAQSQVSEPAPTNIRVHMHLW
jgi:hypothetical protein